MNCIKRAKEKRGGCAVVESSVCYLRDFTSNTSAIDLGFSGPSFTWSNRKEGLANIKERLDQCLCDQEWQSLSPKAGVRHLCNSNSDHNPIMLDTFLDTDILTRPFHFEAMWTREEESRSVVEDAWQCRVDGSQGFKLIKKLSVTSKSLSAGTKAPLAIQRKKLMASKPKLLRFNNSRPQERIWNLKLP